MTTRDQKKKYWDKKHNEARVIECACGCGRTLKEVDHYGRPQKFINGHNGRKYKDPKQYAREWNHRNRKKRLEYKTKYSHTRKSKLLILLGGKCRDCGRTYDGTNGAGFDFHHTFPNEKKFGLNLTSLVNHKWSELVGESKKCEILCAYCHRIHHFTGF